MIEHVVTETGFLEVSFDDGKPVKVTSGFYTHTTKSEEKGVPDTQHYDIHVHNFAPENKDELAKMVKVYIKALHYLVGERG